MGDVVGIGLLLGAAVVAALLLVHGSRRVRRLVRRRRGRQYVVYLQTQYLKLLAMPRPQARRVLNRQLVALSDKVPGQSLEWYLERLLNDLERARR